jgi:hypothetical protein
MTGTVSSLARRFQVQVSSDNATWLNVNGLEDFAFDVKPTLQATNFYETNGWESASKNMQAGSAVLKFIRRFTAGVPDPGQELLRAALDQFGVPGHVYVQWFDRTTGLEARGGWAWVEWKPTKTATADNEEITATLTADGGFPALPNVTIVNPVPVITSVTPAAVGTAGMIEIQGSFFTGTIAAGVKIGGTTATSYILVSDNVITAILPSGSAGSAPVTVQNGAGASASFPYTRAA